MQRVFQRSGVEEEEITPPCMKTRSFDSLSVAQILQAKLDPTAGGTLPKGSGYAPSNPTSPSDGDLSSPTVDDAAVLLQDVQSSARAQVGMGSAIDCLMALSGADASAAPAAMGKGARPPSAEPKGKGKGKAGGGAGSKRPAQGDAAGTTPTPRRRLKMRSGASGGATGRAASRAAAAVAAAAAAAAEAELHTLQVAGIDCPVRILSGASLQQLKLLSAAFKLCPNPTGEQIVAVARRVGVSADKLDTWFQSRRTLQEWVQQQPHLQPADLANMFYPEAAALLGGNPDLLADEAQALHAEETERHAMLAEAKMGGAEASAADIDALPVAPACADVAAPAVQAAEGEVPAAVNGEAEGPSSGEEPPIAAAHTPVDSPVVAPVEG